MITLLLMVLAVVLLGLSTFWSERRTPIQLARRWSDSMGHGAAHSHAGNTRTSMKPTLITIAIVLGLWLGILRWIRPDGFSAGAHYTHVPTIQEEAAAGFKPAPAMSKGFRVQPM